MLSEFPKLLTISAFSILEDFIIFQNYPYQENKFV